MPVRIGGGASDAIGVKLGFHGAFTASRQLVSMAKLRSPFSGLTLGRQSVSSGVTTKQPRVIRDGTYVSVKLPGAGEVRLDLSKHIDKSLKTTSDVISKRFKLTGRNG